MKFALHLRVILFTVLLTVRLFSSDGGMICISSKPMVPVVAPAISMYRASGTGVSLFDPAAWLTIFQLVGYLMV